MAESRDWLDLAGRRIEKAVRQYGTPRVRNPKPLRALHGRYQHRVFDRVMKVLAAFERMSHATALLRDLPLHRTLKTWNLRTDRWVEYQYEFHLTGLVSVPDRCLLLVNDVLRCGLHSRDCNQQTLLRHERLVGTSICTALKQLLKEVEPKRPRRNSAIHEGESPPIGEIIELEEYDWLPLWSLVESRTSERIHPSVGVVRKLFRSSSRLPSIACWAACPPTSRHGARGPTGK